MELRVRPRAPDRPQSGRTPSLGGSLRRYIKPPSPSAMDGLPPGSPASPAKRLPGVSLEGSPSVPVGPRCPAVWIVQPRLQEPYTPWCPIRLGSPQCRPRFHTGCLLSLLGPAIPQTCTPLGRRVLPLRKSFKEFGSNWLHAVLFVNSAWWAQASTCSTPSTGLTTHGPGCGGGEQGPPQLG